MPNEYAMCRYNHLVTLFILTFFLFIWILKKAVVGMNIEVYLHLNTDESSLQNFKFLVAASFRRLLSTRSYC